MSILVDEKTKVVVQGITGNEGMFHTRQMVEYGTKVVAGVTPGKGGQKIDRIPVFNTVSEAVKKTEPMPLRSSSLRPFAADAILEAADAAISLIVCLTEGIPTLDMVMVREYLKEEKVEIGRTEYSWDYFPGKM